jgi:hypothetical protein
MSDERPAETAQQKRPSQLALALGAMLIPLFFVVMFAICIIGTYHAPDPNGIKVAIVGPPRATAPLSALVAKEAGSAFEISQEPSLAEAVHDVSQRDLNAAFVPTANPRRPATLVVASANGRIVATAAEVLARNVAAAQGAQLAVREVRPLPSGDEIGLGIFMFMVVCTICGYITPTVLETVTPALGASRRYPIVAVTSFLVAILATVIGGAFYGVYDAPFGTILAFIGVGALYTFTIGLGTRLFQVLLGPPGIFASLAIFVFLNIPSLGATYTAPVLSPFFRFLNHFWIGAATVDALRAILYFGGQGVGGDLLKVLAWTAAIAVILLLPLSRRLERKRERTLPPAAAGPPASSLAAEA